LIKLNIDYIDFLGGITSYRVMAIGLKPSTEVYQVEFECADFDTIVFMTVVFNRILSNDLLTLNSYMINSPNNHNIKKLDELGNI
jgi:hypothetical protein